MMHYPTLRRLAFAMFVVASITHLDQPQAVAKRITMKPGDAAPKWTALKSTDDKSYTLESFEKAKAVVVVFISNDCPIAQSYETYLTNVSKEWAKAGVALVAINANNGKNDSLKEMKKRVKERKIGYLYLRDETQKVAKSHGAVCTPQAFVFDQKRKLAYSGLIDDDIMRRGKAGKKFLATAVDEILAGKKVTTPTTKAMGCAIRWK